MTQGRKTRRRRRADLTGYEVTVRGGTDTALAEEAYRALAEEFWRWWARKSAAEKNK